MLRIGSRRFCLILIAIAAICLSTTAVWAQSQANTGSIEGIVSDPSGRSIPGAAVAVVNTDTNFTRKLTTDSEGFGLVRSAYMRIVNRANGEELARFDLTTEAAANTAIIFGEVYRKGGGWHFEGLGDICQGGLVGLVTHFGVTVK